MAQGQGPPFRSVLAPALASPPRDIQSTVDPSTEGAGVDHSAVGAALSQPLASARLLIATL
jgi:hypothetical protein